MNTNSAPDIATVDINSVVARYLQAWNEKDPAARRAIIDEVWAVDGHYTDPMADLVGQDALDAVIAAVQGQFPGFVFTLGSVDAHHDLARFTWNLGPEGEEALVVGFDVARLDGAGRIQSIQGFLDKVPAGL